MGKNQKIEWSYLDDEKANFIFTQSKEYLDKTIAACDQLDTKATALLGISIVMLNSITAYMFVNFESIKHMVVALGIYVIMLFISSFLLIYAIKPAEYHLPGNLSENFLKNEILQHSLSNIIIGDSQNYTKRAKKNNAQNKKKASYIRAAIYILVTAPIIAGIILLISIQTPFSTVGGIPMVGGGNSPNIETGGISTLGGGGDGFLSASGIYRIEK